MYKLIATSLALVVTAAGCATKGFVREQVGALQTQTQSDIANVNGALSTERSARMAGDSALRMDIAALRGALDSLRTEYGAKITALESGMRFALPVHFAFNDVAVRDADRAALDRFADVVKRYYGSSTITIEGFADPAGSASYNRRLSQRRADAVKSYLTSQGLTGDLRTVGYGETRLVRAGAAGNSDGAELNRRVVFVIESGEAVATNGSL